MFALGTNMRLLASPLLYVDYQLDASIIIYS